MRISDKSTHNTVLNGHQRPRNRAFEEHRFEPACERFRIEARGDSSKRLSGVFLGD